MAGAVLTLEGLEKYLQSLGKSVLAVDWVPALRRAAVLLAAEAKLAFHYGRAPDGSAWKPLKNPSRKRGGATAKPLRDTGLLMASLAGGGPQHAEDVSPLALVWGTRVRYAGFHQYGTKHIPARPFLGFTPALESRIDLLFRDHAEQVLKGVVP